MEENLNMNQEPMDLQEPSVSTQESTEQKEGSFVDFVDFQEVNTDTVPLSEQEDFKKKMSLKKKIFLIITLVLVALLLGGGVTVGALYFTSPEYVLIHSITGAVEDLGKREELEPFRGVFSEGSLEFRFVGTEDVKLSKDAGEELSGKLYFSEDAVMLDNLSWRLGGKNAPTLTMDAYLDSQRAYVSNEEILGGTYGAERGNLVDQWKKSIFAFGKGEYSVETQEEHDAIVRMLEVLDEKEQTDQISEDAAKLLEQYAKDFYRLLCKNGELTSEYSDRVKVGNERISARVLTLTIDNEEFADALNSLYDQASSDQELSALMGQISDLLTDEDWEDIGFEGTLFEWYDEMFVEDKDGLIEDAIQDIEDLDFKIEITAVTPRFGTKLMKLDVKFSSHGDHASLSLNCGTEGIKKTDKISLTFEDLALIYTVKTDTASTYKGLLELDLNTAGYYTAEMKIDKNKETYRLELFELYSDGTKSGYDVKGDWEQDKDMTTISVDSVKKIGIAGDLEATETYRCDIRLIFLKEDTMPVPETDVQDFLLIGQKDIEAWNKRGEEFEQKVEPFWE